jgi:hypothetical protein
VWSLFSPPARRISQGLCGTRREGVSMNRKLTTLASLFAAGAFVATAAAPKLGTATVKSSHDVSMVEVGCGGDKDKKDASCGKDKKDKKDASCGKDKKEMKKDGKKDEKKEKDASCGKGSCGSKKEALTLDDMKKDEKKEMKKEHKKGHKKDEKKDKDASCGKGSCGSKK